MRQFFISGLPVDLSRHPFADWMCQRETCAVSYPHYHVTLGCCGTSLPTPPYRGPDWVPNDHVCPDQAFGDALAAAAMGRERV